MINYSDAAKAYAAALGQPETTLQSSVAAAYDAGLKAGRAAVPADAVAVEGNPNPDDVVQPPDWRWITLAEMRAGFARMDAWIARQETEAK